MCTSDSLSFDRDMIGDVHIPEYIYRTSNDSDFLERIYPEHALRDAHNNPRFFIRYAFLSIRNVNIEGLNNVLLEKMNGAAHKFDSFDYADLNKNALGHEEMRAEYLRSITIASLPLGTLQLQIGAPLMLMKNLDPQHGLYNGPRMTLLRASRH
jgi:PIF1-like helicase